MNKWLSRKLFVAVGGVVATALINLGLSEELAAKITEVMVDLCMTYIAGQSAVDVVKAVKGG